MVYKLYVGEFGLSLGIMSDVYTIMFSMGKSVRVSCCHLLENIGNRFRKVDNTCEGVVGGVLGVRFL